MVADGAFDGSLKNHGVLSGVHIPVTSSFGPDDLVGVLGYQDVHRLGNVDAATLCGGLHANGEGVTDIGRDLWGWGGSLGRGVGCLNRGGSGGIGASLLGAPPQARMEASKKGSNKISCECWR